MFELTILEICRISKITLSEENYLKFIAGITIYLEEAFKSNSIDMNIIKIKTRNGVVILLHHKKNMKIIFFCRAIVLQLIMSAGVHVMLKH